MLLVGMGERKMVKTENGNKREYYGLVLADVDQDAQRIDIRPRPKSRQPIGGDVVQKCVRWALLRLQAKYPGYEINEQAASA